jgi:hypothetical protein
MDKPVMGTGSVVLTSEVMQIRIRSWFVISLRYALREELQTCLTIYLAVPLYNHSSHCLNNLKIEQRGLFDSASPHLCSFISIVGPSRSIPTFSSRSVLAVFHRAIDTSKFGNLRDGVCENADLVLSVDGFMSRAAFHIASSSGFPPIAAAVAHFLSITSLEIWGHC